MKPEDDEETPAQGGRAGRLSCRLGKRAGGPFDAFRNAYVRVGAPRE